MQHTVINRTFKKIVTQCGHVYTLKDLSVEDLPHQFSANLMQSRLQLW